MIWEDLNENLIVPDLEAKSSDEVFEKLGGLFIAEGYCRDTYVDALKDREKDFPTGVNMGSIGIAIPHTDKQHVIKGGVAIGVLKESVHFYQMGTTDEPGSKISIYACSGRSKRTFSLFTENSCSTPGSGCFS